jgi:putative membrane protein
VTVADSSPDSQASDKSRYLPEWLVVLLKGLAMGGADAVPGVSGGTIALITGIYERMIAALTALDPRVFRSVTKIHRPDARAALIDDLVEMDVPFLITLGVGMITAVIVLARVIHVALETIPAPTFAFFAGLIGASAVVMGDRRWLTRPTHVLAALLGFALAYLVAGASSAGVFPQTLPVIFVAGVIAICGMILPGISGAFILLLVGQYGFLTGVLSRFVDQLLALALGGDTSQLIDDGLVVFTFVAGAIVGLLTTAHVVRFALVRYRTATYAFLVSLMVGALRYPVIQIAATDPEPMMMAVVGGAALAGVALVGMLDRYTDDLEYEPDESTTSVL